MRKLYDCFLYNDEYDLLSIRLNLLSSIVDRFVIVASTKTFTGVTKKQAFPFEHQEFRKNRDLIDLIILEDLPEGSAWDKEFFSRNAILGKLEALRARDLVMISDIDEIPRPDVIMSLKCDRSRLEKVVLGLDYFNFRFNFLMVHGLQAIWRGPVVVEYQLFTTPQATRDVRNSDPLGKAIRVIDNAGWHFSYLTKTDDVENKLNSFAHQEIEVQSRRDSVERLIQNREGFHDHLHPGSVWAIVGVGALKCEKIERMITEMPQYLVQEAPDSIEFNQYRSKLAVERMMIEERKKLLRWCSVGEMKNEILRRLRNRIQRLTFRRIMKR